MENIQKTSDYSIFKYLVGNRKVNLKKSHLRNLKNSIQKDNLLNLHPIIVNKNLEIIDGQHRLQAAKELGIEIYYIQSETVKDEHLIDCNVNQKSWELDNYIDYFSEKEKLSDYISLQNLMKKTGLKPKALLTLIIGNVSTSLLLFMKTGKFKLPINPDFYKNIESYLDFISFVNDKRLSPKSMFTNHYFTGAFRWLILTSGFNFKLFISKLEQRWFDLKPQRGSEDFYKLLISIYNFKNHTRLEEEYGKIS